MTSDPSSRLNILLVGALPAPVMDALEANYDTVKLWTIADHSKYLSENGSRFQALVTSSFHGVSAPLMGRLPNLKLIACMGVGTDLIDLNAAESAGVAVTNTPSVLNECVADHALGLLLALFRRIAEGDRFVRGGKWSTGQLPLGAKLGGKVCGIVGMGGIGREIAKRVAACGMQIAYCGPSAKSDLVYRYYGSILDLAHDADVLILSLPGRVETRHVVDAAVLAALGPKGMIINVARGNVIDEDALVEALKSHAVAGAGLDVFCDEPNVPEALLSLDNVVLTPHIASATHESREAMASLLLANVKALASGTPLLTRV